MLKEFVKAGIPEIRVGDYTATGRIEYEDGCVSEDKLLSISVYFIFEVRYVSYMNVGQRSPALKLYNEVIEEYLDEIIEVDDSIELLFISEKINDKIYQKIIGYEETKEIKKHVKIMYEMFLHMTGYDRDFDGIIDTSVPKDIFVSFDDLLMIKSGVNTSFKNFDEERFTTDGKSNSNAMLKLHFLSQQELNEFYECFAYGVSHDKREAVIDKTVEIIRERTIKDEMDINLDEFDDLDDNFDDFDDPFWNLMTVIIINHK